MKSTGFILILSSLLLVGCGNNGSEENAAGTEETGTQKPATTLEQAKTEAEEAKIAQQKAEEELHALQNFNKLQKACESLVVPAETYPLILNKCKGSGVSYEKFKLCRSSTFIDQDSETPFYEFMTCLEQTDLEQIRACNQLVGGKDVQTCIEIVKNSEITEEEIKGCSSGWKWLDVSKLNCLRDILIISKPEPESNLSP